MPKPLSKLMRPAFRANTPTTGATANTTLLYKNKPLDRTGSMNMATGKFTAPVAGLYRFEANLLMEPPSGGGIIGQAFKWRLNGVDVEDGKHVYVNSAVQHSPIYHSILLQLALGDTAEIYMLQNVYGSDEAYTSFQGQLQL